MFLNILTEAIQLQPSGVNELTNWTAFLPNRPDRQQLGDRHITACNCSWKQWIKIRDPNLMIYSMLLNGPCHHLTSESLYPYFHIVSTISRCKFHDTPIGEPRGWGVGVICVWGPFHRRFSIVIHYWKICFAANQFLTIQSLRTFVQAMTKQLSCHMQNL